ncbi:ribbon-helix-helix domain-containing protein [Parvularcula maris]|uniref:Ribbon-helix-helix domain-containing protein n=1 Tax=Parvularcula maris TaxID=2965077 RepID=A0A9X2L6N7_9PROT|nr:ribbon-helix-helix domain-containing protein [Parvularcula maris]MCQ8184114.1 ribbon-helix-helix domain-containing protein [Parvularcula maris]
MSITATRPKRINLLVSEEEKQAIDAKAKAAGISSSELIRRAVEFYEPDVDWEELSYLADELGNMADRMEAKLDALAERTKARRAELEELRKAAPTLTATSWPFPLPEKADV